MNVPEPQHSAPRIGPVRCATMRKSWEEESTDSGFNSDIELLANSCKAKRNSLYSDRVNNNHHQCHQGQQRQRAEGNSRSLPTPSRGLGGDGFPPEARDMTLSDFTHVRNLGGGGFAKVDLVQYERKGFRGLFALKKIHKKFFAEPKQEIQFEAEKEVLSRSQSRFILKLVRTFYSPNHVFLLTEACLHGDLFSYLERHGPMRCTAARYVIACVTEALDHLHKKLHVIHRDVKTENVLIGRQGVAKLADFGFCKLLPPGGDITHTFCGTPGYIAPEVILHTGHTYSADYFSLGVVAYEMLTCRSPFRRIALIDTHKATLRGITDVSFPSQLNHVTQSFVRGLCYREAERRLGREIRLHEWFYGFNWKDLQRGQMTSPLQVADSPLALASPSTDPPAV